MTEVAGYCVTEDFSSQIQRFGINPSKIYRNLTPDELVEISVNQKEGVVNATGSLSVNTGKYTGRSPDDRFIVLDDITRDTVDWGKINHPFSPEKFANILEKMKKFVLLHFGFENPTPEIMDAWNAWFESISDQTVENVGFSGGREISKNGTRELPWDMESITGYSVIEADSLDKAEAIAKTNPFIS